MHVDQVMELVRAVPGCMDVLTVGLLPTEGDQEPAPAILPVNSTMAQAVDHSRHVERDTPPRIPQERDVSTHMFLALGLQDQETCSRLIDTCNTMSSWIQFLWKQWTIVCSVQSGGPLMSHLNTKMYI